MEGKSSQSCYRVFSWKIIGENILIFFLFARIYKFFQFFCLMFTVIAAVSKQEDLK